jgi:hypothetical protein
MLLLLHRTGSGAESQAAKTTRRVPLLSGRLSRRLTGLQSTLELELSVAVDLLLWGKLCGSPAAPC